MPAVSPVDRLLVAMREIVDLLDRQAPFDNRNAVEVYDHYARQIHVATAREPHWPSAPVYLIDGDVYKIEPHPCPCGGSFAWLRERPSGGWETVGCICHHLPTREGKG